MWRNAVCNISIVGGVILIMVVAYGVDSVLDAGYTRYGLVPRSTEHWYHIAFAPFIHGSYSHLASNSAALGIFGLITVFRSRSLFVWSSIFIIILGGSMVWLLGRTSLHIGASGWIYGLWAMTMGIAWYDRKFLNIVLGLLVLLFYGGMSWGILPTKAGVSFEMHLAGAVAGLLYAYIYVRWGKSSGSSFW